MNIQVFLGEVENPQRSEKPLATASGSNSQSTRYKTNQWRPRNLIYAGLPVIFTLIFSLQNLIHSRKINENQTTTLSENI